MFAEPGAARALAGDATESGDATPVGIVATRLALALADTDVVFIAADEQRAEAVARTLAAVTTEAGVLHVPASDALPGDDAPASPANAGRRVAALYGARAARAADRRTALIVSAEAAARLYPPPEAFDVALPRIAVGDALESATLERLLHEIGYLADDRVDEPGEIAVRGLVVDIFPADAGQPARVELEDGRVKAIRAYDPVTQLATAELDSLEIGRSAEPATGPEPVPLFDHLPGAAVAVDPRAAGHRDRFLALVEDAARMRPAGRAEPVADAARWAKALAGRATIDIGMGDAAAGRRFVEGRGALRSFGKAVRAALAGGDRVVLAGAPRDLRFLGRQLRDLEPVAAAGWDDIVAAAPGDLLTLAAPLDRGWRDAGLMVIAAADVIGSRALTVAAAEAPANPLLGETGELRLGDVVVHEEFGLGVVAGLEATAGDGATAGDTIVLEYQGGDRRLVPVAEADRLWRYGGEADAVTLDKLDGTSWLKRRGDIDAAIATSARALTDLAEQRAARSCAPIEPDVAAYERFSAGFPFTETADQARAIAAVRADLASGRPSDRLIVGDVGYGKTEVALRAAALVALAGGQVAIAAPTTVLVRQHLESFRRRFAGTGIEVAGLSRLSSPAEKKAAKAGLADGSIGIVVGTAAIAGKGISYADLRLVVIDEEQRFGAADKAKLRGLSPDGHMLTLTATPIPRTLQTALVGLQQLSVIATPPARRQPIRTSVAAFDAATVRTALLREKSRGGQSFVVVPRIEDMASMAGRLAELVPELVRREAHGKLGPAEIDEAMVAFAGGQGDVLLATNIIEAGLDVPRANTMIVWRADRFGLSQLHQLRGRVGRGGRRGQVLLLTEAGATIAPATLKRLRTLQAFDRLGAGFAISARDLDVRGAGDLLGDAQAGHMKLIGVDLYQHLLEGALRTARGEAVDDWRPELRLGIEGCFPGSWIPDVEARISLYCRLARLIDRDSLDTFEAELEDRFGTLPPEARRLLDIAAIRALAVSAGLARLDAGPAALAVTPRRDFAGDLAALGFEAKGDRFILAERIADPAARVARLAGLLEQLEPS